jgi:chromosomal replication initiation ATPase DnaA
MFEQKNYAEATLTALIIKGERCSGKTHLLHAMNPGTRIPSCAMTATVAQLGLRVPGEFLTEDEITNINLLNFLQPNHFYFFENIEEVKSEELLLNLINSAAENKAFLILTSRIWPNFQLKDLTSRLKNMTQKEIKEPSQESVKQLVVNQLARRQIKASTAEIGRICNNTKSYAQIVDAVKMAENRL